MFEHLNLILFSALNAQAGLTGRQLMAAVFAAQWLIFVMPLSLVMLWLGGGPGREVALRAFIAAGCALTLNALTLYTLDVSFARSASRRLTREVTASGIAMNGILASGPTKHV